MTPARYHLHRLALAFGINRRNQRMSEAASETHLLKEAEAYLGSLIWENIESIEPLSSTYWNLRKITKEKESVTAKISELQQKLDKAHADRSELLNTPSDSENALLDEKTNLVTKLNELAARRDDIIASAKQIRKSYDGLKVKSEVLAKESPDSKPDTASHSKIQSSLVDLKAKFNSLKNERDEVSRLIDHSDARITAINDELKTLKKGQHGLASKAFQTIGEFNKELSALRAELGILDTRMTQLHSEIGKHVSRNTQTDPTCAEAVRSHQGLTEIMAALRLSISLNYKLAGN